MLTFAHFWSALMLVIQSLGLYFDKPDVILFGHFSTNISLKAGRLEAKKEFLVLERPKAHITDLYSQVDLFNNQLGQPLF